MIIIFIKNLNYPEQELVSVTFDPPPYSKQQQDSVKQSLSELTSAFFETSRWMLMNNKRD
jgi:hypothetical protein